METVAVKVPYGARPGQLLQMTSPTGQKIQCPVPAGVPPGGTFHVKYKVGPKGPTIIDERSKGKAVAAHILPAYWANVKVPDNNAFDQMIYVDRQKHEKFNELLENTYRAKATQDRKCPRGACPKTPGGCPCVQPGASPGLPTGFKVRRVVRVEDSEMWGRYVDQRNAIAQRRAAEMPIQQLDPPAVSNEVVSQEVADDDAGGNSRIFEPPDLELNEMYLWHGTNVRSALSIAQSDFRIDLAGSSTGTMYGLGAYFAEHCTKADEYATDEPNGYYEGVFALLLCRVCLGKFYYTQVRDTEAGSHVRSGGYDSTVGDRLTKADTFREFVLYNADAIYPEYVVLYTRVHHADPPDNVARLTADLYHLQLPVYWANCDKDPLRQPFHEQFLVAQYTVALLQELATACFKGTGSVEVVRAKRIENSQVWQKYVEHKRKMLQKIQAAKRDKPDFKFLTARDLDDAHGEILTFSFLSARDSTEECVSITNLEEPLNENLLWHGTSKEAAEKIAESDFKIPVGKDMKHAARFGNGAYLAEDLEKSLSYTEPTSDGTRIVLLCRTLCGDFYYTERHQEINASQLRDAQGKHSVLANPERKGPREFIVPTADQVYPEFVLELSVKDWEPPPPVLLQKTKLQVQVPPGVGPGSLIAVQAPDGRQVQVVLPPGAVPGATLELEV